MNDVLWKPSEAYIKKTHIESLRKKINVTYSLNLDSYQDLYNWSISNISDFWKIVLEDVGILYSGKYNSVVDDKCKMPGAKWFYGLKLNFAENLLKHRNQNVAIEFYGENKDSYKITYKELFDLVSSVSFYLKSVGIKKGDRVAAIMPNIPETIISMLAVTSLGAVWSSCSPEFGAKSISDRFSQIKPKMIISTNGYYFKGKAYNIENKISKVSNLIESVQNTIIVDYLNLDYNQNNSWGRIIKKSVKSLKFEKFPFDHPIYILYSSGTTGKPKSIVHSSGGTLIQHLKELRYHVNLKQDDKIFYYTTCGWMMWNWLVSSLACGSTVVLYEGNPFYPNKSSLLKIMNKTNINIFGTSAKYISYLKSVDCFPKEKGSFSKLRTILSTGSPLTEDLFDFVYKFWKKDVQLSSISGGTDIISCFALGSPTLPVKRGEIQTIGLGMSVKSYSDDGTHQYNIKGELVCDKAFPSMPIYFWNDDKNEKYKKTYFKRNKNIWTHGDFILINEEYGVKIFGRSDTTLNPGGVRIGTSEIYQIVDLFPYVLDSLVVGQKWLDDERIILFIKLEDGFVLNKKNINDIKNKIKSNCTPRHIPSKIIPIEDIPYTINGKKVEIAVKKIINGEEVTNLSSICNPKSLMQYQDIKELRL